MEMKFFCSLKVNFQVLDKEVVKFPSSNLNFGSGTIFCHLVVFADFSSTWRRALRQDWLPVWMWMKCQGFIVNKCHWLVNAMHLVCSCKVVWGDGRKSYEGRSSKLRSNLHERLQGATVGGFWGGKSIHMQSDRGATRGQQWGSSS